MTRRTNLLTLRKYFAWRSLWFQTDSYQGLVVRDLVINTFLSGICSRLGIVSSHFSIRSTIFNINIIDTELFFFSKKQMMPLFFCDTSFLHCFDILVETFRYNVTNPDDIDIDNNTTIGFFESKLHFFEDFVHFFVTKYIPFLFKDFKSRFSFFFKINMLYSSYNSVLLYIYHKQQFNLFFFFLDSIYNFNTIPNLETLQSTNYYSTFMSSAKDSTTFFSYSSNIFSRYTLSHVSKRYIRTKSHSFSSNITTSTNKDVVTFDIPRYFFFYSNTLFGDAFHISYSLLFVLHTYFNLNRLDLDNTIVPGLKYFFYISILSQKSNSFDGIYNNHFFSNISNVLQTRNKRSSLLFFYWFLKFIWVSFFNSTFLNIIGANSVDLCSVYTHLNSVYQFVFFIFEQNKYSFFFNSLYVTLFRQFNTFIYKEDSVSALFYRNALRSLYHTIELSICSYTGNTFLFLPRFFFETPPFITNSKIICEYLKLCLLNGLTVSRSFKKIARWHKAQRRYIKRKISSNQIQLRPDINSQVYKSSLKGIRITCSGPPYKARRKMRKKYHLWLAREFISGTMPLQSFKFTIDYFQSYVRLKRSSIGLKVWTLFEKHEDKVFW